MFRQNMVKESLLEDVRTFTNLTNLFLNSK